MPLLTSPAVTVGTVWGIPQDRSLLVIREGTEVIADRSVFFTSDRVAVRGIMRVSWGFPHPASIIKITLATPSSTAANATDHRPASRTDARPASRGVLGHGIATRPASSACR